MLKTENLGRLLMYFSKRTNSSMNLLNLKIYFKYKSLDGDYDLIVAYTKKCSQIKSETSIFIQ